MNLKIDDGQFRYLCYKAEYFFFEISEYSWTSECIQFYFSFRLWIRFFYHRATLQIFYSSPRALKRPLSLYWRKKCINFDCCSEMAIISCFFVDKQWTKMWIICHESAKVECKNDHQKSHDERCALKLLFMHIYFVDGRFICHSCFMFFLFYKICYFFCFSKKLFHWSFFCSGEHDLSNNLKTYS